METQGVVKVVASRPTRVPDYVLRSVAAATTVIAAVVMALAKETTTVGVQVAPTLPPLPVVATAKSSYSSAFMYFVVANAFACLCSTYSLAKLIRDRPDTGKPVLPISILDLMVVALLFSGNGAAAAIGVMGRNGNSHIGWNKVCGVFGKFCNQATASIVVSLLGSLAYLLLVVLAVVRLHKRSP